MYKRYLVTHGDTEDENAYTNGLVLGSYDRSLKAYHALSAVARRAFPGLNTADVECLVVTESRWCKGQALVRFSVPAGTTADGWESRRAERLDVRWG